MENVLSRKDLSPINISDNKSTTAVNLSQAVTDTEYTIKKINAVDDELIGFLFTLGCYEGEKITLISKLSDNYVISVKDARYSIDFELAEAIII